MDLEVANRDKSWSLEELRAHRDHAMFQNICRKSEGDTILVLVGAGHDGVATLLEKTETYSVTRIFFDTTYPQDLWSLVALFCLKTNETKCVKSLRDKVTQSGNTKDVYIQVPQDEEAFDTKECISKVSGTIDALCEVQQATEATALPSDVIGSISEVFYDALNV